jgi:hypothetical protein
MVLQTEFEFSAPSPVLFVITSDTKIENLQTVMWKANES